MFVLGGRHTGEFFLSGASSDLKNDLTLNGLCDSQMDETRSATETLQPLMQVKILPGFTAEMNY